MTEKPKLHVVSFSGGKDSTAMLLRMLEEGMPVDIILFCDTGLEFPDMYRHIEKVEKNTGRQVTVLRYEQSFEYLFLDKVIKRKRNTSYASQHGFTHNGYSWAGPKMRWCTEKLKNKPRNDFLRQHKDKYDIIEYVGIAADEGYRLKREINQRENCRHPLVDWGMTEADCLAYCKERGYDWNGLYDHFKRVSCWCCPLQSLKELRQLYTYYPSHWKQLREWDDKTWRQFRADYSVAQLEQRFAFEDAWTADGKKTGTKEFFKTLNDYLTEADNGKQKSHPRQSL